MFAKHALLALAVTSLADLVQRADARTFTVLNNCTYKLWPAVYTGDPAGGKPSGIAALGGWELEAGKTSKFDVPDNWLAGRLWARTDCDFSKPEVQSCSTGSCVGGERCTLPGEPPVTLAEFTLSKAGKDNYDVSLVDGSNVPVEIKVSGCGTASCPKDLNPDCPGPLQTKNSSGVTVGCQSACKAFGGEENCCSGDHNLPSTCPSSGVQYYDYFKTNCPRSYAYAYDESSGTALWTCTGNQNYAITFCP